MLEMVQGSDRMLAATGLHAAGVGIGVERGAPVSYRCAGCRRRVVRQGRRSEGSLSCARLRLPGDRSLTLPQLGSGSGARYSDERQWQW
jgi:membrane-bound inhibitor of C-type lysozyme